MRSRKFHPLFLLSVYKDIEFEYILQELSIRSTNNINQQKSDELLMVSQVYDYKVNKYYEF